MERLFFECAVRAALLVSGTALVLYAMRVKAAAAKHSVWASVVLLMLVLPLWTAWGPKASLHVLPPLAQTTAKEAIAPVRTISIAFLPSSLAATLQSVLLGVYLLGLSLLMLRLAIGTVRARRLVREAVSHNGMCISSLCAAPVTVGFFHPTVIVPEHWHQWPQAQLDAVLTHEHEHARRRDSLVQWLALLNRALFWFHPVAWWLERHLSALAEEACDSVVLAHGHSPHSYSEYLIDMARSVTRSGARLNVAGMAMPGSFLPQRIRQIIEGGQVPRISRTRMACVTAACAITCTVFAAGKLDRARQVFPEQSTKTVPEPASPLEILTPHEGVDFTVFDSHLIEAVKGNWYTKMPQDAKKGDKGKVVVRFKVQRDGTFLDKMPTVEVSSGKKPLDDAAVAAIRASTPFDHLPESFKGPYIELRLSFYYNIPMSPQHP
jgi:TonB family protein